FQQALRSNPDFSEALLELANLRIANKRLEEAAELLRRYVKVSRNAASGYYKLAMVERSLHQLAAAQRDLMFFRRFRRTLRRARIRISTFSITSITAPTFHLKRGRNWI